MMPTENPTTQSSGATFTLVLVCAVALSMLFVSWMKRSGSPSADEIGGLAVGRTAPRLSADVWIQGEAPEPEDLEGNVYVVVAWATWCLACYEEAPHLVEVYEQFKDDNVLFYGLTVAPPDAEPELRQWLNETKIPWPNGFGMQVAATYENYEVEYIPAIWVIGRDGNVWWNRGMSESETLEEALHRTLDQSRPVTDTSES